MYFTISNKILSPLHRNHDRIYNKFSNFPEFYTGQSRIIGHSVSHANKHCDCATGNYLKISATQDCSKTLYHVNLQPLAI